MRIRIIPATIAIAALLIVAKTFDVVQGTQTISPHMLSSMEQSMPGLKRKQKILSAEENAELKPSADKPEDKATPKPEEKPADKPAEKTTDKPTDKPADGAASPADKPADAKPADAKEEEKSEKGDKCKNPAVKDSAGETIDHHYTQIELGLLQNLSQRRDELDRWEKNIEIKETTLDAAEKRVDDKVTQIDAMKKEVSDLLAEYNEKEDAKIKSLVKIYESMKPKDAARIFDEVEMPILLIVIDKMSEKKIAPILADMDPKKAQQVTVELAEQRKVNSMKLKNVSAMTMKKP